MLSLGLIRQIAGETLNAVFGLEKLVGGISNTKRYPMAITFSGKLLTKGGIDLKQVWYHGIPYPHLPIRQATIVAKCFGDAEHSRMQLELSANAP